MKHNILSNKKHRKEDHFQKVTVQQGTKKYSIYIYHDSKTKSQRQRFKGIDGEEIRNLPSLLHSKDRDHERQKRWTHRVSNHL